MGTENDARKDIVAACREMNATGFNTGTSGNISVRHGDRMLITPSAVPYDRMTPEMIASLDLAGDMTGTWDGPLKPPYRTRTTQKVAAFYVAQAVVPVATVDVV